MNGANFESALIEQKNHILTLVNNDNYEEAILKLKFVKDMWISVDYGYKVREIIERIVKQIDEQMIDVHWKTASQLKFFRTSALMLE
jgi:transcriptional regulator